MAHQWKKQASVAYGYALTRLALNTYMYFESLPLTYEDSEKKREAVDASYMGLLSGFLNGDLALEKVFDLREQLRKNMEAVIAYADSFRIYEYALNRVERRMVEGLPKPSMEEDAFVDHLMGFLTAEKDMAVTNRRIQEVIGQLPIRFTRQKYYSMVREALGIYVGSDRSSLEGIMYMLRTAASIELSEEQKELYPELKALLTDLEQLSFRELDEVRYHEAEQKITLATEEIFCLSDYFQMMVEMLNDLYVLTLTQKDAVRDAYEEEHTFAILRGICTLYEAKEREIPEKIEEELSFLEGTQESYYEKYQRLEPAPEYQEGEDEEAYQARCIEKLMSSSEFMSLEDEKVSGTVSDAEVDRAMEQFVERLEPVLKQVQKPVARAIMAATLANLPICFNSLDEVKDYITNSFASCTDMAEKETCMELLEQMMGMEDYALV